MMHDNYDPDKDHNVIKLRKELPKTNWLYFVYCSKIVSYENYRSNGLLYMQDGEWLAYPHKYGLNTIEINNKFIACIGPLPEKIE